MDNVHWTFHNTTKVWTFGIIAGKVSTQLAAGRGIWTTLVKTQALEHQIEHRSRGIRTTRADLNSRKLKTLGPEVSRESVYNFKHPNLELN